MKIFQADDFFLSKNHTFSIFIQENQCVEDVHGHEFDELVIVKSGSGFHIINGQVEFIYEGDFFLISNTDIHYYISTNNLTIINILFKKSYDFKFLKNIQEIANAFRTSNSENYTCASLSEKDLDVVVRHVEHIKSMDDDNYDDMYFSSVESFLFSTIITLLNAKKTSHDKHNNGFLPRKYIFDFIKRNYMKKIDWNVLSSDVGIPRRTIYRFFKQITGLTPEKFHKTFKLLKSQELIRTSDLSISSISEACGFTFPARLSEAYKITFNKTPTEERKGK